MQFNVHARFCFTFNSMVGYLNDWAPCMVETKENTAIYSKKKLLFLKAKKKENQSLHFDVKFILKSKVNNFICSRIN